MKVFLLLYNNFFICTTSALTRSLVKFSFFVTATAVHCFCIKPFKCYYKWNSSFSFPFDHFIMHVLVVTLLLLAITEKNKVWITDFSLCVLTKEMSSKISPKLAARSVRASCTFWETWKFKRELNLITWNNHQDQGLMHHKVRRRR